MAHLAGVSADYYVRLEQGRAVNVSDSVLDAVARVLRLSPAEHEHLRNLARPGGGDEHRPEADPGTLRLIELMRDVPAMIFGPDTTILATNALADTVFGFTPGVPMNGARYLFLNPRVHALFPGWRDLADEVVAHLRLQAGRRPGDTPLAGLIAELRATSTDFTRRWERQDVLRKISGPVLIAHPALGELELTYQLYPVPGSGGQHLAAYGYEEGSTTGKRLRER
ncbi:transcriptional regulator [Winogradskya humida]|uniref:Transcriptional regulator n=1 Tax=Winogradskya humida TaxID=113566 RepID=A0ABQ3ZHC8_9ACTN|nr:transcriptional regulator [Actinoplanes humidus]